MTTYLDYAAATPLSATALRAMEPYFSDQFYNPSALYLAARAVRDQLKAARRAVAGELGANESEIIFTAGGTEANNLAIHGVMQRFLTSKMLVSAVEHESVLAPAAEYQTTIIGVDAKGKINLADLKGALNDEVVLISCMLANNEVGTIQPVQEIAEMVDETRRDRQARGVDLPLYLHTDACQTINYLDCHVGRLGVDLLTLNGGKIYGPKQSGALYVRAGVELKPLILGGGQEKNMRSGTENVAAICGLAAAMTEARRLAGSETKRLTILRDATIKKLIAILPTVVVNGHLKKRLPNNIHLTLPGVDNERLMMMLDERGVMVATGSACAAASGEPSHVLRAMGIDDAAARSSLRVTMGRQTTAEDMERFLVALKDAAAELKKLKN